MKKKYFILLALVATFQTTLQAQTVTIGTQIWTTTNLDVDTYSDGTPIPQVTDPTAWSNLTTGAWCYYNNDPANGDVYGKLYNWYAVAGIYDAASLANPALRKNIAPTGWHVPTDAEWTALSTYLGGESIAGGAMKEAGTTHWSNPNTAATNSSGFTGLPGGYRYFDGSFGFVDLLTNYWSGLSEVSTSEVWYRELSYSNSNFFRNFYVKNYGFSVRLVSDQLGFEQQTISKIGVYPNPVCTSFTIQTPNNFTLTKVFITDTTGKVVLEQTQNTTQVNVEQLASGMYIVQAFSGEEKFTSKFVKE